MKAKEKKPSYSRHISTRLWSGGFEKNQSRRFFLLFRRCSCNQEGGIWEDTAMSIFVIHSTHELHQLKKACSQQRSNAVRSVHYTM